MNKIKITFILILLAIFCTSSECSEKKNAKVSVWKIPSVLAAQQKVARGYPLTEQEKLYDNEQEFIFFAHGQHRIDNIPIELDSQINDEIFKILGNILCNEQVIEMVRYFNWSKTRKGMKYYAKMEYKIDDIYVGFKAYFDEMMISRCMFYVSYTNQDIVDELFNIVPKTSYKFVMKNWKFPVHLSPEQIRYKEKITGSKYVPGPTYYGLLFTLTEPIIFHK